MFALTAILITAIAAISPQAEDRSQPRSPKTDETLTVQRGARLLIDSFAGDIAVRAWDRDAIRVQARHSSRTRVTVREVATGVRISSGAPGVVDYEISAPSWMPVRVNGHFNFVTIEGVQSEVSAETHRGDIVVKGGNGVNAKSVEGEVILEGAKGRINVSSVNQGVTINGASGEIVAETVNGPIALSRIEAASVEANTINGNIAYEGTAASVGRYRLTSHNGSILVGLPETSNATFSVRTYNGAFSSNLPVKGQGDMRRGRRVVYTLGNGSAEFELESFSGSIRLFRPGTMPAGKNKHRN